MWVAQGADSPSACFSIRAPKLSRVGSLLQNSTALSCPSTHLIISSLKISNNSWEQKIVCSPLTCMEKEACSCSVKCIHCARKEYFIYTSQNFMMRTPYSFEGKFEMFSFFLVTRLTQQNLIKDFQIQSKITSKVAIVIHQIWLH